jgi:hypothetical protein
MDREGCQGSDLEEQNIGILEGVVLDNDLKTAAFGGRGWTPSFLYSSRVFVINKKK